MKVKRVYEKDVKRLKVGDQIQLGKYTATAVRDNGDGTITFLLDQYLDRLYDHRNLISIINLNLLNDPNFEELVKSEYMDLIYIDDCWYRFRVPYVGEIFDATTENGEWVREFCEPDDGKGFFPTFECMRDMKNRISKRKNASIFIGGWLMNSFLNIRHAFAFVDKDGDADREFNSAIFGVRPVFNLFTNL